MYGAQVIWNANWTPRIASSLGIGVFDIVNRAALGLAGGANPPNYNAGGVPNNNQGNTPRCQRRFGLQLQSHRCQRQRHLYFGQLPALQWQVSHQALRRIHEQPRADPAKGSANNQGYWGGITLGKSGKKGTWDIFYRYQYLEADAWYDELVDDDNVAFYSNKSTALAKNGWVSGTNVKGHLVKFNYSLTDALTFSFTAYINDLINPNLNTGGLGEPKNQCHARHGRPDVEILTGM